MIKTYNSILKWYMLYKNLILLTCNCCLIWFCHKKDPKKYKCVLKGSYKTVHTPIFQVVQYLLNPGEWI